MSGLTEGDPKRAERDDIEAAIRSAFAGVQLGSGVSLQEARFADERRSISAAELAAARRLETTDDWTLIPYAELARDNIAHLDAEGLRYYLPALMLWLLDHYDDEDEGMDDAVSMTVIGTVFALAPASEFAARQWEIYDRFTPAQRTAMARYVEALPRMVDLRYVDPTLIGRAMDRYWSRFLPEA